ncbi:MAG: mechanosensitive ion channel family protein [Longimonas sp.]|uniref:mechanosensitive ion channel family protein n=1 Tax=Longimonas sp. TaxID=2039626 RepID=UPI0039753FFB
MDLELLQSTAQSLLEHPRAIGVFWAIVKIAAGFVLGRLAGHGLVQLLGQQSDPHQSMLIRRLAFYLILGLFTASALSELGVDLSILLGAAGILTVALGFASQTSASNIISGLFLLGEKPFGVGDIVKVGNTTGEVIAVDLLSVKLRTFDNLFVRIPNETMIKAEITNLRRFPIRRFDLQVGVAYKEDLDRVREVLQTVADEHPLSLDEPVPMVLFMGFGESSINFQFSVWTLTENFLEIRTQIPLAVKEAFDQHSIEIPFPHRTLYTGSKTTPMPVRLDQHDETPEASDIPQAPGTTSSDDT